MSCVFCQALQGEIEVAKVWEGEHGLAFLDHRPVFPGHVLLIPRRHLVTLDQLLPAEALPLFEQLRILSRSVPRALDAEGSFVANNNRVSQSVPHLHWHVVPRRRKDGLKGFFWPRQPYRDDSHREEVRRALSQTHLQETILDFWFGPARPEGVSDDSFQRRWFLQDALFDGEIRSRFEPWMERALAGELDHWAESARGRLALILLLDQFTRNLYRHTGRAFVGDPQAQRLAREGVERGQDRELALDERSFFYLPFEHGESAEWQRLSLESFARLVEDAPSAWKGRAESYLDYARRHAVIIERFGRYPHRNQALERETSPAEAEFLRSPDSSFW